MPKKILIVDDEPHISLLIATALEELEEQDVQILTAHDGLEAFKSIQTELPDLVFLDVTMPGMDGFTVCKKVRELQLPNITIIILTAKGQQSDKAKSQEVGADFCMQKPFDPQELLKKARDVLKINA